MIPSGTTPTGADETSVVHDFDPSVFKTPPRRPSGASPIDWFVARIDQVCELIARSGSRITHVTVLGTPRMVGRIADAHARGQLHHLGDISYTFQLQQYTGYAASDEVFEVTAIDSGNRFHAGILGLAFDRPVTDAHLETRWVLTLDGMSPVSAESTTSALLR